MNIRARVKFRNLKNAEHLIQAFFNEFNRDNKIAIKGNRAKIEIFFQEEPPEKIIKAISCCEVVELRYGNPIDKVFEKEFEWEEESHDEPKTAEAKTPQLEAEEAEVPQIEPESVEVEEEETPQTEAKTEEDEEVETPQPEAELVEVEEEEAPQPEAEPVEVGEEEEPQPEAESVEVEEEEEPQPKAESAEAEEEEEPQPETEPVEVEEEELQSEAEPEEAEEEEESQPETEPVEVEEEEALQPEPEPEEAEEKEALQPEAESAEAEEEETPQPKPKKKGRPKVVGPETVNIPYLKELAEKATSFEHFVKLVAEWLEMGKYQEFFENLGIAATQVSKMSWSELKKALARNKVCYTESTKIKTVKHVSEKIEKYNTTLLPFLGAIALYQNYSFASEDVKMDVWPKDEKKEEHSDEDENPTSVKVKMQCIPEIRSFEETLSSVDKTQPIEERVKHVLTAMGWEKKDNKEKALILAIVRGAITVKEMNFDNIFQKAGIPVSDNFMARMHLAKLINDFVKMHYPSHKMVNVLDFLKELQEIVVLESEIEDFAD